MYRVSNQLNPRLGALRRKLYCDHIHPTGNSQPAFSHIHLSNPQNLPLLSGVNCLCWRAKSDRTPGLHLDKDQDLPFLGDEIDLSQWRGKVFLQDPKAEPFQETAGHRLPFDPDISPVRHTYLSPRVRGNRICRSGPKVLR